MMPEIIIELTSVMKMSEITSKQVLAWARRTEVQRTQKHSWKICKAIKS